jgi:hypothetical protein
MELKTERQESLIVCNLEKVFKDNNIEHLNKSAYKYLNLCAGFIAHYSLYGFRNYYSDISLLKDDLIRNQQANQWNNFTPNDKDYDYIMQKKSIYNRIMKIIDN